MAEPTHRDFLAIPDFSRAELDALWSTESAKSALPRWGPPDLMPSESRLSYSTSIMTSSACSDDGAGD